MFNLKKSIIMENETLYGIWVYANGGWNLLYQYPRSYSLERECEIFAKARQNMPTARLKIGVVED